MKNKLLIAILFFSVTVSYAQSTSFDWVKQLSGLSTTKAITTDQNGNQYTIGSFNDTVDFDPGPGIHNLISTSYRDMFILKMDVSGNFVWAKQIASTGRIEANDISLDRFDNIYITGYSEDTVDLDPGPGINILITDNFYENTFVLKLDPAGDFIWARLFGDGSYSYGTSISVDPVGNVYTTGYFHGTCDFDPGIDSFKLLSSGGTIDAYISKLDASGNFAWAKNIGASGDDYGVSVNADSSGNVYITGSFENTVDFNPGPVIYHMFSAGSADVFILKMDSLGNFLWSQRFGSYENDLPADVTLDADCNIYLCGTFEGTSDFDPNSGVYNMTSSGSSTIDIFILKLDSLSNFIWAQKMGGVSNEIPHSIFVDNFNSVYTTGDFPGTSDFDPGPSTFNLSSSGYRDIFISKLDLSGSFLWAKQIGGSGYDYSYSIAVDPFYNVYTTGRFQSIVDFDPGTAAYNLTGIPGSSFIHKMNQLSVGVTENDRLTDWRIYPNPSEGQITIDVDKETTIKIVDLLSKKVLEKRISEPTFLDISYLPNGVYFILNLQNGESLKFLKQ
jgi:hypothetical protein